MTSPNTQTIRCANCGTPMPVAVRSLVDAQRDAEGKSLLISDQINKFQCPNCGALNVVDAPLLYHDATKELLIAYVPMGVAAQQGKSDERIIGDLMNMLTSNLPKDQFKAYMFNPRRALTMNGLIDQVLEADGISPEVMAQQRARVDLIQRMLQSATPDALISLIKGSDDKIDAQFMQTFSLMIQRMMAQGPDEMAEIMMGLQEALLENSSYGRDLI
ncbi:MAG: CpXC domain-containing protein, partial [Anaerolineae bacterium]|nr:CpXC domain-containing protein [Anaerolineae bacterium]